jgi:anti-anti-sigma factor
VTSSEQLLIIDADSDGNGRVVLQLAGEIDPHSVGALTDAVAPYLVDDAVAELVLDLAGVSFIDSSGLRAIIAADSALVSRDAALVLRSPSEATRRLLEMTDLFSRLRVE